jgi:hypothetical protein
MSLERLAQMSIPDRRSARSSSLGALGALAGLILPALALGGWWILVHWGGSTIRGAAGFLLAAFAGPTLLLLGVPIKGGPARYTIAFVTSAALWLVLGGWAGRRATRIGLPTWSRWLREFLWLAIPLWLGSIAAYAIGYKLSN